MIRYILMCTRGCATPGGVEGSIAEIHRRNVQGTFSACPNCGERTYGVPVMPSTTLVREPSLAEPDSNEALDGLLLSLMRLDGGYLSNADRETARQELRDFARRVREHDTRERPTQPDLRPLRDLRDP